MTIAESKAAAGAALGGRTARACDNCLLKRARWFCASDDAFLCQVCDASVHSANQLAGRHHRVRLQTASFKATGDDGESSPGWQHGFTPRKARSRRRPAKMQLQPKPTAEEDSLIFPVVPEMEELFPEEKDEHMVHRVPEYFEFDEDNGFNNEFCVEELLNDVGELLDEEMNGSEKENGKRVKVEEDEDDEEVRAVIGAHFDFTIDKELMNWEFDDDYGCSIPGEAKGVDDNNIENNTMDNNMERGSKVEKTMLLRLNYEEVIDAWASQGCPWENGVRPILDLDDFMAECARVDSQPFEGARKQHHAEREARVSRYKEKRRTRLFSKKIRYEVRKLNAEQRPRIKGRFVKRANFLESSLSYTLNK